MLFYASRVYLAKVGTRKLLLKINGTDENENVVTITRGESYAQADPVSVAQAEADATTVATIMGVEYTGIEE